MESAESEAKKEGQPGSPPGVAFAQQPALPQLIYETAPFGLAYLSCDCRYLQINQRMTEICGISVAAHLGRTVRECLPTLADSVELIVGSIVATGEPVAGIEIAGQRANQNTDRVWMTYWHPVRNADGEIAGINVAAEEITERKNAEAALKASERQFRTLADAIPQLVWMADGRGRIFWFNRHWYDFTGDSGARDWWTFLAPDVAPDICLSWAQSVKTGVALEMEMSLRGRDGAYRPFLTRAVPVRDEAGTVNRWIGTHIDISPSFRP